MVRGARHQGVCWEPAWCACISSRCPALSAIHADLYQPVLNMPMKQLRVTACCVAVGCPRPELLAAIRGRGSVDRKVMTPCPTRPCRSPTEVFPAFFSGAIRSMSVAIKIPANRCVGVWSVQSQTAYLSLCQETRKMGAADGNYPGQG